MLGLMHSWCVAWSLSGYLSHPSKVLSHHWDVCQMYITQNFSLPLGPSPPAGPSACLQEMLPLLSQIHCPSDSGLSCISYLNVPVLIELPHLLLGTLVLFGAFLTELKLKFFMLRYSSLECPLACDSALVSKVGPLNECFNKPLWFYYPHSDTLQLGPDHTFLKGMFSVTQHSMLPAT